MPPKKKRRRPSGNKGKLRVSYPGQHDDWEPDPKQLEIWALIEQGDKHQDIADKFGVSRGRITQLSKQMRRWKARQIMPTIEALQRRHEAILEKIIDEALTEWERSKRNGVTTTKRHDDDGGTTTVVTKGQCGDPRYLAEARAALDDIRKIRGANAPIATEITGTVGVVHSGHVELGVRIVQRDDFYRNDAHDRDAEAIEASVATVVVNSAVQDRGLRPPVG